MAKILIVGTGGVGTIAGLSLTQHGNEVTFVVRSNFEELKKTGYNIESCDHGDQKNWKPHRMVNSVQEAIADGEKYDYVLVAMKALPDVFSTADIIRPVVESSPDVAIVLFQNGLNIEEPIVKAFPKNVCVSGVSMIGSTNLGAGEIHQAEPDYVKIGFFDNGSDKAAQEKRAKEFVQAYGPKFAHYVDDVVYHRWRKLLYNATFNTICSITRMDSGRLWLNGVSDSLIRPAMGEIRAIAKADGHILTEEDEDYMIDSDGEVYYKPSMLVDVEKGNLMEMEVILKAPLDVAKKYNVPTPILSVVYELLKCLQFQLKEAKGMVDLPEKLERKSALH